MNTPTTEQSAKDVAEKLLVAAKDEIQGARICSDRAFLDVDAYGLEQVCTRLLELEEENKRLANVPVKWNEDIYNEGYKAREIELDALKSQLAKSQKEKVSWMSKYADAMNQLHTSQARCGKIFEALSILVQAKTVKEWNGDTDYYRKLKEQGWSLAKELVGINHTSKPSKPQ